MKNFYSTYFNLFLHLFCRITFRQLLTLVQSLKIFDKFSYKLKESPLVQLYNTIIFDATLLLFSENLS